MLSTDVAGRLRNGLLLGIVTALAAFPYLFHQSMGAWSAPIARDWGVGGEAGTIFAFEFSLLLGVIFMCSIIGVFLSERYNLPGFGKARDAYQIAYRYGAPALLFGLVVGWLLHDRTFYQVVPAETGIDLYPRNVLWSVALLLNVSVMKEMVFRFGVLTLAAGLFRGRRPILAVVLTAVFAASFSVRELLFVDYARLDAQVWYCVIWSFISNIILGMVFVRKGLLSSMSLRACVDMRFVLYPILGMV